MKRIQVYTPQLKTVSIYLSYQNGSRSQSVERLGFGMIDWRMVVQ